MYLNWELLGNVLMLRLYLKEEIGLGIAQQCNGIWELLSNVIR